MPTPFTHADRSRRAAFALAACLVGIGLLSRLAPFFDQEGRLLQQFPTEDGYLMLTIARNIGIGHGMSIADGTIATNGTQPLTTFLWGLVFWIVGGDKTAGVAGVLMTELILSLASVGVLFMLGRRVLAELVHGEAVAAVAAAAWFASALTARHGMNCLESGAYALVVVSFGWTLLRLADRAPARPALARWAGLGALLGVAFWVRVDAVLLCAAVGVTHLLGWLPAWRGDLRDRFFELCAAGTACAALASPWLLYSFLSFGSIMPVSGQSEGFRVVLGQELPLIPAKLAEYLSVVLQIPNPIETHPLIILAAALFLALAALGVARSWSRWPIAARSIAALAAAFGAGLVLWYGPFFGAGHFMSRYLFPLSPFLALATTAWVFHGCRRLPHGALLGRAVGIAAIFATAGLNARIYARGSEHEHFQVVHWIDANVPENVWVGAIQTGTLGFFHDRTVNLDGKVNPAAMVARRSGAIPQYVADSEIQYLVDWQGISAWFDRHPVLRERFDIVPSDPEQNLAVLARHGAPRLRSTTLDPGVATE